MTEMSVFEDSKSWNDSFDPTPTELRKGKKDSTTTTAPGIFNCNLDFDRAKKHHISQENSS
jgi:hypothetical protein